MIIINILLGIILMGAGLLIFIPQIKEIFNEEPDNYGSTRQLAVLSFALILLGLVIIIRELFF